MKPLTYATVCSGIECMSVAAIGLPLVPVFFSEIEPFPCAVLKAHYPHVPNLGDMSRIKINEGIATNGRTDVSIPGGQLGILAGGTPCQDVSVAGLRRGMQEGSGTRSSLAFEFVRLIREARPRFVLWENVDGVRSDQSFPGFLRAIGECGYSVAYRVLDAQYVRCSGYDHPHYAHAGVDGMERAIPQRRRRVWVVGCLGADDLAAARILFEHDCMLGDRPPRRRTRQEARPAAGCGAAVHGRVVERNAGINPQSSLMYPVEHECSQTLAIGHGGGVVTERVHSVRGDVNAGGDMLHCEVAETIRANASATIKGVIAMIERAECYDNHAQDSRMVKQDDVSPQLNAKAGTGGQPSRCGDGEDET